MLAPILASPSNSEQLFRPEDANLKEIAAIGEIMRSQYLHLRVFSCNLCRGPVVCGSTAVRESDIQRETEIKDVGAICLSCGYRQTEPTEPDSTRHFPPVLWETPTVTRDFMVSAYLETLSRAEPR